MRWLTNTTDPKKKREARQNLTRLASETEAQAWENYLAWLEDKYIGNPKATETHTTVELADMNMVGVYKVD